MIELQHLAKSYGAHQVIRDIHVSLFPGEIIGLLGANGAGKSTTMNMITGCLAPSSGRILINGRDITHHPKEVKRQVGYLPEIPPLYENLTVSEQLFFACRLKLGSISGAQSARQVEKVCAAADLVPVKDRLISHLSKGYRQRVGLAQAILGDPQILVLDEPTVGLDPAQIMEIQDLIRALSPGRIILFSSHILSEVGAVCSRILVLADGRIVADGSVQELESSLEDPGRIQLRVAGDPDTIRRVLRSFPQIRQTSALPLPEGRFDIDLTLDGTDIRSDLAKAMVENNIRLLSMGRRRVPLEKVYAHFVAAAAGSAATDETAAAAAAGSAAGSVSIAETGRGKNI